MYKVTVLVTQSCLTLCDPMDCSPPGFLCLQNSQARTLEWVATPFSRESSWPRDWIPVSHIVGRFFTVEPPGKPQYTCVHTHKSEWAWSLWNHRHCRIQASCSHIVEKQSIFEALPFFCGWHWSQSISLIRKLLLYIFILLVLMELSSSVRHIIC